MYNDFIRGFIAIVRFYQVSMSSIEGIKHFWGGSNEAIAYYYIEINILPIVIKFKVVSSFLNQNLVNLYAIFSLKSETQAGVKFLIWKVGQTLKYLLEAKIV